VNGNVADISLLPERKRGKGLAEHQAAQPLIQNRTAIGKASRTAHQAAQPGN